MSISTIIIGFAWFVISIGIVIPTFKHDRCFLLWD